MTSKPSQLTLNSAKKRWRVELAKARLSRLAGLILVSFGAYGIFAHGLYSALEERLTSAPALTIAEASGSLVAASEQVRLEGHLEAVEPLLMPDYFEPVVCGEVRLEAFASGSWPAAGFGALLFHWQQVAERVELIDQTGRAPLAIDLGELPMVVDLGARSEVEYTEDALKERLCVARYAMFNFPLAQPCWRGLFVHTELERSMLQQGADVVVLASVDGRGRIVDSPDAAAIIILGTLPRVLAELRGERTLRLSIGVALLVSGLSLLRVGSSFRFGFNEHRVA